MVKTRFVPRKCGSDAQEQAVANNLALEESKQPIITVFYQGNSSSHLLRCSYVVPETCLTLAYNSN